MQTADEIMSFSEPGELFTDNIAAMKEEYSALAKIWHPDYNGNSDEANAVMSKINLLYKSGLEMLRCGKWKKPGYVKYMSVDGKSHQINYRKESVFELGTSYICDSVVVYIIHKEFKDLFQNAVKRINSFEYANDKMKNEISKCLPRIVSQFETPDNFMAMVVEKEHDMFLLKDVLELYDGRLPDRHVAWILGSLYNTACYLDFSGISHNAITTDTCFISPEKHSIKLLGGWWYSVPVHSRMVGVPEKIFAIMPPKVRTSKLSNIITDLEAIRLIGRELMGDRTGASLAGLGMPSSFAEWLRAAALDSALEEYSRWNDVLIESYGARRFVHMELTGEMLYTRKKSNKI